MQEKTVKSFDTEITRLYPSLRLRSVKICRSSDDGSELLQQVVSDMIATEERRKKAESLASRGELEPYMIRALYVCATGANSNFNRNKLRIAGEPTDRESWQQWTENVDSRMAARIFNENVDLLISRLNEFDAELLRLWALPGFSYKDASATTGIPTTQLKASINTSLNKIRKYVHGSTGSQAATS